MSISVLVVVGAVIAALVVHRVRKGYELYKSNDSRYQYTFINKLRSMLVNPLAKRKIYLNILRKFGFLKAAADRGMQAPEATVVTLDGKRMKLIGDLHMASPNIPLVLNIGSYN